MGWARLPLLVRARCVEKLRLQMLDEVSLFRLDRIPCGLTRHMVLPRKQNQVVRLTGLNQRFDHLNRGGQRSIDIGGSVDQQQMPIEISRYA